MHHPGGPVFHEGYKFWVPLPPARPLPSHPPSRPHSSTDSFIHSLSLLFIMTCSPLALLSPFWECHCVTLLCVRFRCVRPSTLVFLCSLMYGKSAWPRLTLSRLALARPRAPPPPPPPPGGGGGGLPAPQSCCKKKKTTEFSEFMVCCVSGLASPYLRPCFSPPQALLLHTSGLASVYAHSLAGYMP